MSALTNEDRIALRCMCWAGHHKRFCPVPTVERILAERIAQARREGAADELETVVRSGGPNAATAEWMTRRAAALRGDA